MKRDKLRIAVQKSGRLRDNSLIYFAQLGLEVAEHSKRALLASCRHTDCEFLFVRHGDIPTYVQSGVADFAIVGGNVLCENDWRVRQIKPLDFGHCRLVIAAPASRALLDSSELDGERIATSYPNSLRKFLRQQQINAAIIEIAGSVEIAPALGLCDAICDLVQTGTTLQENNLVPFTTIFNSCAVVIESPYDSPAKNALREKILQTDCPQNIAENKLCNDSITLN